MEHSQLYNFFFPDEYKIIINIIVILAIILFVFILKKVLKRKKKKFNLLFLIMLNVMISGILCPLAYLLNWKVKKNSESNERELLFGKSEDFICQSQSFLLSFFQSSRETFVTLLIITIVLFYHKKIDNNMIYKIIFISIGYGVPFFSNLIYSIIGAFGESHLFCFTAINTKNVTVYCGTIHFTYIFILLLISLSLTIYIIIQFRKDAKKDVWFDEGKSKLICCNDLDIQKIIYYCIAQIITMGLIFYYRFRDYFYKMSDLDDIVQVAGICSIFNAISSIIYTIIFIISNICNKVIKDSLEETIFELSDVLYDD